MIPKVLAALCFVLTVMSGVRAESPEGVSSETSQSISFASERDEAFIGKLELSESELEILNQNPVLDVVVVVGMAPYSMLENNQLKGYFVDLLETMVQGTGIGISYKAQEQWSLPGAQGIAENRYFLSTSGQLSKEFKDIHEDHKLIGAIDMNVDTLILNRAKSGLYSTEMFSKLSVVLPLQELLIRKSKRYGLTDSQIMVPTINDAARKVASEDKLFTVMDYPRAQYHRKRDITNSLELIRFQSLNLGIETIKSQIGVSIHRNSKILSLLEKLYKHIDPEKLDEISRKWLWHYQYEKPKGQLAIEFDLRELNFLNNNKEIRYIGWSDDKPLEYLENQKWSGFIVDILRLFEEVTGAKIKYIPSSSFEVTDKLDELKSHKAHFFLSKKAATEKQHNFRTEELYVYHNHYITRYDKAYIRNIKDLFKKKIVVRVDGKRNLSKNGLKSNLKTTTSYRESLQAVSQGKYDLAIAPSWTLFNSDVSRGIHDLKVNSWAREYDQDHPIQVCFQVDRNHLELVSILNKFINNLKKNNMLGMTKRWFGNDHLAINQLLSVQGKMEGRVLEDLQKANDFLRIPKMPGLNNEELKYLKGLSKLRISMDPNRLPFSYYNERRNMREGLVLNYLDRVSEMLNVNFEYVNAKPNTKVEQLLLDKKVDLYATSIFSEGEKHEFNHASPYGTYPFSFVVLKKRGNINVEWLNGKKIGIPAHHPYLTFLSKAYPEFKLIKVKNISDGFMKVKRGQLYACIDIDPIVKYELRKNNFPELQIGGSLKSKASIAFAVHKGHPAELVSIINKALARIDNFDRKRFEDQWFSMKVQVEEVTDYTTLVIVVIFTMILSLFFIYWNGKLSRLNQVIKEKESLSRSLLESTNAVPYHFDFMQGRFTYIAPQMTKFMGSLPQDFHHFEDWAMLIHPEDREKLFEVRKSAIEHQSEEFTAIYRIKNKNEKYIWVKDMASIVYEKGHAINMQGLFLDITMEKNQAIAIQAAREAAESANRAKSQFLANMSHEIRTPLNPIIGLAHLALTTNPSHDQVRDYMSKIHSSSKSLLRIINDILDFSKMEAEKMNLEKIPFDLNQLIERMNSLYSVKSSEKGIQLKFEKDDQLHPYIIGDPLRMEQVIGNLISNAIKFTDQGSVTLKIETVLKDKHQETLKFEVIDTGLGIPEENLHKIFELFSQADDSNTRTHGGTGLGLNICKKLIAMMGGQIEAKSTPGKGSVFYFTLKMELATAEECVQHHQLSLSKDKLPYFKKTKILLAEDNMINKQVAEELLKAVNLDISHVRNGQECVDEVMRGEVELILMDIQMPVMDGFEATKRIRADQRFSNLPIIAMTAQAFASEKKESFAAGMNAHVTKPIDPKELYETLADYIEVERIITEAPVIKNTVESDLKVDSDLLDVQAGIDRLRGNENLYKDIVLDFCKNDESFMNELDQQLAAENYDEARASLHQLKGAAGNIGANDLFQTAGELEARFKNHEPHEKALEDFKRSFTLSFKLIRKYCQKGNATVELNGNSTIHEKADDIFRQLCEEIEKASPNALKTVEQLEKLVDANQKEFVLNVKSSLNEFDFKAAAQIISKHISV